MGYRKFKGDQIFTGKVFAPQNSVLITGETGAIEAIVPEAEAGDDIRKVDGIISPGFINAHCHLELSHMKGLVPQGTGMVDFLLQIMQQRNSNRDLIAEAIAAAENEMLAAGIVAVGDICNTDDTLIQKQQGRLYYHNFIECSGFVPAAAHSRFESANQLLLQMEKISPCTIVPHAPYSVSPELFQLVGSAAAGKTCTMHNQESAAENEFFLSGEGGFRKLFAAIGVSLDFFHPPHTTSLQAVWPLLTAAQKMILVHNVVTSQDDLSLVKEHPGLFFCLCPNANRYINNSLPPVELLLDNSCTIVLGTDSLASNETLSILAEIKTLHQGFPELPIATLFQWATSNGAIALGIDQQYGTFEKNKRPGIINVSDWTVKRLL